MSERLIVKNAILYWHKKKWAVHLLTVMPDHVHIIASPLQKTCERWFSLSEILQSVKGFSARKINLLRRESGPLWQAESFDRIIRDEREYYEKMNYVLNNAAEAGLVEEGWKYDGLWRSGRA